MNLPLSGPVILLILGLVLIFFPLCGIITWTTRLSTRLSKVEPQKWKSLFAIAFLQVLLGVLTVIALKAIKENPVIDLGTGLGITFLSGLFLQKLILKKSWKQCLRVWAIATAMQLVLVSVYSLVMLAGCVFVFLLFFHPQF